MARLAAYRASRRLQTRRTDGERAALVRNVLLIGDAQGLSGRAIFAIDGRIAGQTIQRAA